MISKGFQSRVVNIGDVPLGGDHPVRVQSMTSTNTMDTMGTVQQSIRMIEAGCEYVRITAPGIKEAENLRIIRKELRSRGFYTPIIADIHYQPKAALIAAQYVEKVRINPGNYVDRKKGRIGFTKAEYDAEIEKISDGIKPLIDVCKKNGTAMRIGSNHGSLSERILIRYGNTPTGMVESAVEFMRICDAFDYHDLVISMKASNVKVMLAANRLLVSRMQELGMNYPIHLGVTEAGDAEDGRIKSAAGIGTMLLEGIGDTVRVSLTEDPEFEIPVAKELINYSRQINPDRRHTNLLWSVNQEEYSRRQSNQKGIIGGGNTPVVILDSSKEKWDNTPIKPDYVFTENNSHISLVHVDGKEEKVPIPISIHDIRDINTLETKDSKKKLQVLHVSNITMQDPSLWFNKIKTQNLDLPAILRVDYGNTPMELLLIRATIDFAPFLSHGLLDGIWIKSDLLSEEQLANLSFGILQATGERISKTEYIACPSCGRTLFKIQSTLKIIKEKTASLKGLKIGVMGCCVNGPGEMADADYGYVGAGRGKITLYKGKKIMKIGIKEELAVDELIKLIKQNGDWQ